MDRDHSHYISTWGMQINMNYFINIDGNYSTNPSYYCDFPTMVFAGDWPAKPGVADVANMPYDLGLKVIKYWDDVSTSSTVTTPQEKDGSIGPQRRQQPRKDRLPPRRRSAVHPFNHLVSSTHNSHSAVELCESEFSHGPDFFSASEGILCDMHTKTHWPLCKANETECYHWDTHSLVTGEERRGKNYTRVEAWG